MEKVLKNLFYNVREPSSFSPLQTLLKYKKLNRNSTKIKDVKKWMTSQDSYSRHKYIRSRFNRNPIVSKHINHIWFIDLIEIKNSKENDNYRYILTVIDNLSKKAYAELLKDKKALTVKRSFLKVLKESKSKPSILISDAGSEFVNRDLKKYLKWRKIKHSVLKDGMKASGVERWNRTLKERLQRYMTANNTKRFIDVLSQFVLNYNNSIHSRTKFSPNDVSSENETDVYKNLYRIRTPREKQHFKINDEVRVVLYRDQFAKGYEPNYSEEIFKIYKVYQTSPYYKYRVIDRKGRLIRGSYYGKELVKA